MLTTFGVEWITIKAIVLSRRAYCQFRGPSGNHDEAINHTCQPNNHYEHTSPNWRLHGIWYLATFGSWKANTASLTLIPPKQELNGATAAMIMLERPVGISRSSARVSSHRFG